ncbi:hypothetical protein [Paenibacillus oralis]|nr:hypothetical protein [Paenibacillus oralis]
MRKKYLANNNTTIKKVVFVCFDEMNFEIYKNEVEKRGSKPRSVLDKINYSVRVLVSCMLLSTIIPFVQRVEGEG